MIFIHVDFYQLSENYAILANAFSADPIRQCTICSSPENIYNDGIAPRIVDHIFFKGYKPLVSLIFMLANTVCMIMILEVFFLSFILFLYFLSFFVCLFLSFPDNALEIFFFSLYLSFFLSRSIPTTALQALFLAMIIPTTDLQAFFLSCDDYIYHSSSSFLYFLRGLYLPQLFKTVSLILRPSYR